MSDYDLPSVFNEAHPVARKEHRCCECYQQIPAGAKYQLVRGLWDGQWATYKTCERCEEQRDELAKETKNCTAPFGELREWCFNSDVQFWADPEDDEGPTVKCPNF